jgi:phosphorylcholine metabolism protein LicD
MLKNRTIIDKNQYKKIVVDVFEQFIHFCEQNNLRYYCAYGTALGAVRHQGMIPWDDDIDVYMPRPDYEKFIETYPQQDSKHYEIITPRYNKNYYLAFTKMCNKTTTLLEDEEHLFVIGAFIDIFPLDALCANQQSQIDKANRLLLLFKSSVIRPSINNLRWVLIIIFFEILIPPEPFMRDAPHFFYRKYNKNLL